MEDKEIYLETKARLCAVLHDDNPTPFAMIVELANEVDRYRDKIMHMENMIEMKTNRIHELSAEICELKNEIGELLSEKWVIDKRDAERFTRLSERIEQLGQIVENKMEQVLGEYGQTLTSFVEERAADGGVMTIKKSMCYQDIAQILLSNDYFVCCHIDDENDGETITIEFWRA